MEQEDNQIQFDAGVKKVSIPREKEDDLKALEEIDEATKILSQAEEANEFNKELVNLPVEFECHGKVLKICHKTPKQLIKLNSLLIELHKTLRSSVADGEEDGDYLELLDRISRRVEKIFGLTSDILFLIVNEDPNSPDITKDWIDDNISVTNIGDDDSLGVQILQSYQERCQVANFFSRIADMPLLM